MVYQQFQYQCHPYSEQQQQHYSPQQTPTLDFAPPPSSPWDAQLATPTHAFDDAQFAAAMAATAAYVQQESLLPPITTLEMAEAQAQAEMHTRAEEQQPEGSTPTPTSTTMTIATPSTTTTPLSTTAEKTTQEAQARPIEYEYQPPQVIQLAERPQRRTRKQTAQTQAQPRGEARAQVRVQVQTQAQAQAQATSSQTPPAANSPVEQQQSRTPGKNAAVTSVPAPGQWYDMHALAASKARMNTNGSTSGEQQPQLQTARTKARLAAHPYPRQRRTVSGPAAMSTAHGQVDNSAPGHIPGPSATLPTRFPIVSMASASGSAPSTAPGPRYLVRTDVHYDLRTNTLTAMLELPGVPRAAVRVALGDDARNGTRMLVVRGRMRRIAFPPAVVKDSSGGVKGKERERQDGEGMEDEGYVIRERKCGEFKRVLVVPPETKPEHIQVSMADGILFLRYPAGAQSVAFTQSGALNSTPNPAPAPAQPQARAPMQPRTQVYSRTQAQTGSPRIQGGMQINFRVETAPPDSKSNSESVNGYNQNYPRNQEQGFVQTEAA